VVLLTSARLWGGLLFPALKSPRVQTWLAVASKVLLALEALAAGELGWALEPIWEMVHDAALDALQSSQR